MTYLYTKTVRIFPPNADIYTMEFLFDQLHRVVDDADCRVGEFRHDIHEAPTRR